MMDDMDDLIAFLRARLDEDEQAALSWPEGGRQWQTVGGRKLSYRNDSSEMVTAIDVSNASSLWNEQIYVKYDLDDAPEHIARHDPARVLAEVEAKRRILELHSYATGHSCSVTDGTGYHLNYGEVDGQSACTTLRLLASIYDGHLEYCDTWRP